MGGRKDKSQFSFFERVLVEDIDGRFETRPEVEVKISEDETAFRRSPENVEAASDFDQPTAIQPEKIILSIFLTDYKVKCYIHEMKNSERSYYKGVIMLLQLTE